MKFVKNMVKHTKYNCPHTHITRVINFLFLLIDALQQQVETLQTEIMNVQIKYQKELEKLEKENRDLRQQYLIIKTQRKTGGKKIKVNSRVSIISVCVCVFIKNLFFCYRTEIIN